MPGVLEFTGPPLSGLLANLSSAWLCPVRRRSADGVKRVCHIPCNVSDGSVDHFIFVVVARSCPIVFTKLQLEIAPIVVIIAQCTTFNFAQMPPFVLASIPDKIPDPTPARW